MRKQKGTARRSRTVLRIKVILTIYSLSRFLPRCPSRYSKGALPCGGGSVGRPAEEGLPTSKTTSTARVAR